MVHRAIPIAGKTAEFNQSDIMPICPICGEEHTENGMIGEVCASRASIMQDIDFEC